MIDQEHGVALALSADQVRWLRVHAQHLAPRPAPTAVAAIVRATVGLQAQDADAAALAARARGVQEVATEIERVRVEERSIVRLWAMRGTLHLIAAEDVGWLIPLLGPVALAGARRRHADLGVDGETGARGVRLIRDALGARGPLTRAELAATLAPHGIPTAGQAIVHLIWRAALEGYVCLGPTRAREPTYVLVADWLGGGRPVGRAAALGELARRYLAAFGPAGPEDFAAWSGLPMGEVRVGWRQVAASCLEVSIDGQPAWLPRDRAGWLAERAAAPPVARLLPSFDTYLLGYRSRELVVAAPHARAVHPGGGIIHPVLLVDGRAAGTWRSTRRRAGLEIAVTPFAPLAPPVIAVLEGEVASIGHFLGRPAALHLATPPDEFPRC